MAVRRPLWQKHVRIGGVLLVLVLFVPVLGIFLMQTVALLPKRNHVALNMTGSSMPVTVQEDMAVDSPMMGGMGMGKMWRGEAAAPSMMMADSMPMPVMNSVSVGVTDRKVVRSASLELRAASLDWTIAKIQEVVKNVGGYVENTNVEQPLMGVKTAWLSVRVPADRLDVTIDESKKAASSVVGEHMNASDMTDQDVDITARLNAKRAEESALVSLLDRAAKVSDVIEVTERLSMVRSEIERLQAEQRSLAGQVAMASVSMSITEDPRVAVDTNPVRDGNVVKQSISDISRWGIALGSALVAFVISGVPVLVVYGFVIWVAYRLGRYIADRLFKKK